MPSSASHVPTQLGDYDLLSKIATGGMGTVYRARNRLTGAIYAVKVIAHQTTKNPVLVQRFEREFRAAQMIEHPNVVRAVEYCGTPPYPFLVMEFVDGESVGQRVERAGPVPEEEAVRIISQVCDGLQSAHKQGLVHRDVKPDNILVDQTGTAKLTDLGLVKGEMEGNDLNLTKTGRGLGTPHFMAPEQFRNAKGVDARGDVYSVAATLYAMVTGVTPFDNTSPLDCWLKKMRGEFPPPRELNPAVSERVSWAICRAMHQEPAERPASCREFVEDLTGQSRPSASPALTPKSGGPDNRWYMAYKDETGKQHTVKGQTDGIRKALRDGLLGDAQNIVVSRSKTGPFIPLHSVAEFRDLVASPTPVAVGAPTPREIPVEPPEPLPPMDGLEGTAPRPAAPTPRTPGGRPGSGGHMPAGGTSPTPSDEFQTETRTVRSSGNPVPTPPRPHVPVGASSGSTFDWTPVLAGVVMVLSAVIGFLLFTQRR